MLKIEDFLDFNYEPIAFDISDVDKEKLRNKLGNDYVNHLWELDDARYIAIENCDLQGFETLEDIWFSHDHDGRYALAQLVEDGNGFGYRIIDAYRSGKDMSMNIYISGRQFGKTTMLIKESAKTGATIAVATYHMAKYVQDMAIRMGLKIPEPVTYAEIFRTYRENKTKRYLVDELQMMLRQLNIDICTVDTEPVRFLDHWRSQDGYSPMVVICDEMKEGENDD